MSEAAFSVVAAGPHVTVQDAGRAGHMRFGVPVSGTLDRLALAAANMAIGKAPGTAAIEVSTGGLELQCMAGAVTFAVAGGGFIVERGTSLTGSWIVGAVRAGERLAIKAGPWGNWTYLASAGGLQSPRWLGSAATHALSGLGGGRLQADTQLLVTDATLRANRSRSPFEPLSGPIPCPVSARPRTLIHVVLGPQERFFISDAVSHFLSSSYLLSDSYDGMGVRLKGPAIIPDAPLDMPSEALLRGSVQVSGDGMPTILLADHQTTGGYPKIATVVDADMDGLAQLRPRGALGFVSITPEDATLRHRRHTRNRQAYLNMLAAQTQG